MKPPILFPDRKAAFEHTAAACKTILEDALKTKGKASLLLSGGSTPAPLYEQMSHFDLDWSAISVALVDERWVSVDHAASNTALVMKSLLQNKAADANFIAMKTEATSPFEASDEVNAAYQAVAKPDIIILGMGPDGHTASWFPGSKGLAEAMSPETDALVSGIDATGCPVAGDHAMRLTITLPVVLNAANIYLLITGEKKRAVLEDMSADLPIHKLMLAASDQIETVWAP